MHKQFDLFPSLSIPSSRFQQVSGHIRVGDIRETRDCLQLTAAGDCVCFDLPLLPGEGASPRFILELAELHCKEDSAFAYEILSGGRRLALRTMEPLSSNLCPYFLILRETDLQTGSICIRNISGTPLRFSAAYLHCDSEGIVTEYCDPMEIGMCFPTLTYRDYDKDLALFRQMHQDTCNWKHFTFGAGIEVKYMNLSDDEIRQQLQYVFQLAGDAGIHLIFNFNSWWDGTPTCRDGRGGYLTDAEYQQVVYNPLDGSKSLSIPNIWKNTPWLTMNHPHLNQVRKIRLSHAMELLSRTKAEYLASHGSVPGVKVFIDNEPTYWSQFAYCQSPECGGDFNAYAIGAAARDGVDLTPSGRLSTKQREWLLQNLSAYISDLAESYHQFATEEYGVNRDGNIIYGDHTLAENIYTHIFPHSGYPFADDRHLHYEEHVTKHARLGIEAAGYQDERTLFYASAAGRWGQVNAERCCYTDPGFHHQIYAHGAACDIIFNYFYDQDIAHFHQLDKLEDIPCGEQIFGRTVMHFCPYTKPLTDPSVVCLENMEIAPLRERWVLRPKQLGQGSITFCLRSTDQYPHGGWLELLGLIRPDNGTVRIDAGYAPDALMPLTVLPDNDADHQRIPIKFSLRDLLTQPGRELYLRIQMEMKYYDDWAQMNAIWDVRAVAAFDDQRVIVPAMTLREHRAMALLQAYRLDCRRLQMRFPEADSPEIQALIAEGRYKVGYEALMHNISIKHTQRFVDSTVLCSETHENLPPIIVGTFLNYDPDTKQLRYHTHDARISQYQDHLHLDCPADVPVTIVPSKIAGDMLSHISTNPYTPAAIVNARIPDSPTILSLRRGDAITISLQGNMAKKIDAIRGLARGKVAAIESMSLSAPMHNACLTLETAPGKLHRFELGMNTRLNYLKAPAPFAMLCGDSTLGLEIGSIVLVSFEPETVGDRPLRAMEITPV